MKTAPILPTPPPFSIFAPPFFLVTSNPPFTVLSVVLFLWLNGWSYHIWCAILVNGSTHVETQYLCTRRPWCVFYVTRCHVYWGLTHNMFFYWFPDLISHTNTNAQHTQGPVDWHIHINIYLHQLLWAHSSYPYSKWLN